MGFTSKLTGIHRNESIYIIGGGSSLTGFDFDVLDNKITIACNRSAFEFPAKYMTFIDDQVYEENIGKINKFKGTIICPDYCKKFPINGLIRTKLWNQVKMQRPFLSPAKQVPLGISKTEEEGISTGGNCGFYALTLAHIMGGNPIYLLGIDMRFIEKKKYFYNWIDNAGGEVQYVHMHQAFTYAAPILKDRGIQVYNCSKDSALVWYDYFPMEDIK
jgi:hypothetical protein